MHSVLSIFAHSKIGVATAQAIQKLLLQVYVSISMPRFLLFSSHNDTQNLSLYV